MTWDTSKPAGSRAINLGDDDIRELKTDLQTALRGNGVVASRPAFGTVGFYFATDEQQLYQDTGAAWDVVSTVIPAGTVMLFYQAAAPTGWTESGSLDDHMILAVTEASTNGGSTGGSWDSLSHEHNIPGFGINTSSNRIGVVEASLNTGASIGTTNWYVDASGGNDTGFVTLQTAAGTSTHGSSEHQYAAVIVCSKD